jgi:hypothetical protein
MEPYPELAVELRLATTVEVVGPCPVAGQGVATFSRILAGLHCSS